MATYGTLTEDGQTNAIFIDGPVWFHASGDWSGTIVLQFLSADASTWKTLQTTTAITSDATGQVLINFPAGSGNYVRASLSGSTTPAIAWEFRGKNAASLTL